MQNLLSGTKHILPPPSVTGGGQGGGSLLIFGGTTEGRLAVDVCEQAGNTYYYSTKSSTQDIEMHNGVRLTGAMTNDDISAFCQEHNIKAIIDAAHPFAENLHKEIASACLRTKFSTKGSDPLVENFVRIPVIRIERRYEKHREGIIYCKGYDSAIESLERQAPKMLLALSGANTITKLKPYWQRHKTIFRILQRPESIEIANRNGFPTSNIIFYNEGLQLPTTDSEEQLFRQLGCDAIITKESGMTGGFKEKIQAALRLGIKVIVIEHPQLPDNWVYASGKHTLRRAIEHIVPDFFPLKTGLTTGACATAATKAAAISLLTGDCPEEVSFALPDGEILTIPVECSNRGEASVVKDWSDDPDILRGCRITSKIENGELRIENFSSTQHPSPITHHPSPIVTFLQGEGVGKVTLPGLGIPVGEPAINPTPRRMIENELRQLLHDLSNSHSSFSIPSPTYPSKLAPSPTYPSKLAPSPTYPSKLALHSSFNVTISVENGEELAKKTFNHKVGVVGGISIIGTSGIVSPLSNEAFIHSIRRELEVAWAIGCREIGLVAGLKSEHVLIANTQHISPNTQMRCVHYGNFIGDALKAAYEIGFRNVTLAIMIGKAVKLAEGHLDTHSHKVAMNKEFLKSLTTSSYYQALDNITMARELCDFMPPKFFDTIKEKCYQHCRSVYPDGKLKIMLCNIK